MAIAAGSEDSQRNPDIPQPLPENAEGVLPVAQNLRVGTAEPDPFNAGVQYARLDASGSADPDNDEQQDLEEREYGRQGT